MVPKTTGILIEREMLMLKFTTNQFYSITEYSLLLIKIALSFEKQQMLPKLERHIEKAFTQGKPQTLIMSQKHV